MNRSILILSIVLLSQTQGRANEMSDRRLAELLQPTSAVEMLPGYPKAFAEPRAILPGSAPAKFQGQPPRPGYLAALRVLPHNPAEPAPLATYLSTPQAPVFILLPTVAVIAFPIEPNERAPVPILGRPTFDRAPLSDATLEASIAAVLRSVIPLRALAVPFAPMNLPDPFELQGYIRLPNPLAEDFQPMAVPPRVLLKPNEPVKK